MAETIHSADVAIVGAGGCGLMAAITAADLGGSVLLFEREKQVGGTTAMSASLIVAAGSSLQVEGGVEGLPEELAADISRLNEDQSNKTVTHSLCHLSGKLIDRLIDLGVPLEHLSGYRYAGMSRDWLHATPGRDGTEMTLALLAAVRRRPGIRTYLETQVSELMSKSGTVVGLKAISANGSPFMVRASAVILAASGFGANQEMVARFIPEMVNARYYGARYADGDAINWGLNLGAAAANMQAYQPHSSIAVPEASLVTTYLINNGAIQVNRYGLRFGNETDAYAGHALAIQQQEDAVVMEIFDGKIVEKTLHNYPRFQQTLDSGIVYKAETVADLARLFDLPLHNLQRTIDEYHASFVTGIDQFGRIRFGAPFSPPYYGVRVTSALVQTLGGLRVDLSARVLRENGEPILGLYAGGGSAAGLAGNSPKGYLAGAGLLAAFGLGWIAGRNAVKT